MSRELKFRAWDPDTNTLEQDPYICCLGGGGQDIEFPDIDGNFYPCPNAVLEQYTGLKDKNGVELDWWEGDLFRFLNGMIAYIVFHEGQWQFKDTQKPCYYEAYKTPLFREVPKKIGHIHEVQDAR